MEIRGEFLIRVLLESGYQSWVYEDERIYLARGEEQIGYLEPGAEGDWSSLNVTGHWRPCLEGCLVRWREILGEAELLLERFPRDSETREVPRPTLEGWQVSLEQEDERPTTKFQFYAE